MSVSRIIRIVVWSVVALAFLSVLIVGMNRGFFWNWDWNRNYDYVAQEKEFDAEGIKNIDIETIGGAEFFKSEENEIKIIEKSVKEIDDNDKAKISQNGETLKVEGKLRMRFSFFGLGNAPTKIEIYLPEKEYNEIKVKTTSGDTNLDRIKAKEIELKATSGDITAEELIVTNKLQINMTSGNLDFNYIESKDLKVEITSGDLEINGKAENVDIELTSGNIEVNLDEAPQSIKMNQTSGSVDIAIPENDGFSYSYKLTSGKFTSDFNININGKNGNGNYKNGGPDYEFKATSGKINLKRK
jgi:lia operon protein LiaG